MRTLLMIIAWYVSSLMFSFHVDEPNIRPSLVLTLALLTGVISIACYVSLFYAVFKKL